MAPQGGSEIEMDWVRLIYAPLATRAARGVLIGRLRWRQAPEQGRFSRANVDHFLEGAWARYQRGAQDLPPQPTMGSAMNLRLACFTMSFFEELLANGVERDYAIEIIADAAWRVYRVWAKIALAISCFRPRTRTALGFARVDGGHGAKSITLRFPFNAPGYSIEPAVGVSGIAFDVVRCPVASYFRRHGAGDLCVESWCNLDYALAEMTHERLVRTKTLAGGGDRCDFRVSICRGSAGEAAERAVERAGSTGAGRDRRYEMVSGQPGSLI
jgi:ubiquinone biosynthesis protein